MVGPQTELLLHCIVDQIWAQTKVTKKSLKDRESCELCINPKMQRIDSSNIFSTLNFSDLRKVATKRK